jgi:hypothetical protein
MFSAAVMTVEATRATTVIADLKAEGWRMVDLEGAAERVGAAERMGAGGEGGEPVKR